MSQISCSKQPAKHIPQEGELVTWRFAPELVIRTRLGERREHVSTGQYDSHFYRPSVERYIGQFPIDYQPERFDKISMEQVRQMQLGGDNGYLEFNLMLNGSQFKATDANINGPDGLDHVDQVKVQIQRRGIVDTWTSTAEVYPRLRTRDADGYDEAFSRQYGLDCYTYSNQGSSAIRRTCYGQSSNPDVTGMRIAFMGGPDADWLYAESFEPIYGGLIVRWRIDRRNFAQWQDVDAAIWRLLDAWNIAPENTSLQTQKP
ncbi:MAG: hypothetical protein VXW65_06490 [Pseudomonadota bacterium]|nr:hypothetical protein [Pseudomonadota bacterium]